MSKTKVTYEVVQDGFLLGDFYRAGARVELFPEQARYDLPPHGAMLRAPAAPAVTQPRAKKTAASQE